MQLVILAAGHGRRFGGLKQLAEVGPNREAIMDYTAAAAEQCGYDSIVVIVREDIRDEIVAHLRRAWPSALPVDVLCQPPVPGTAQAVLAARPAIVGPFGVANADDLYGEEALDALIQHFCPAEVISAGESHRERHVLVAFELARTVLNNRPVTRGLCEVSESGQLRVIAEHTVSLRDDGRFDARPLPQNDVHSHARLADVATRVLAGEEMTSMNLWGFHPRMLDHLQEALERFDPSTAPRSELLLPDVVGQLVASGTDEVHVTSTASRCVGLTHNDDLAAVREELQFTEERNASGRGEAAGA